MPKENSYPVRVLVDTSVRGMLSPYVDVAADVSVRLLPEHFDAVYRIMMKESRPGAPCRRQTAILLALAAYVLELADGRRYGTFTDFVRDALLWYDIRLSEVYEIENKSEEHPRGEGCSMQGGGA